MSRDDPPRGLVDVRRGRVDLDPAPAQPAAEPAPPPRTRLPGRPARAAARRRAGRPRRSRRRGAARRPRGSARPAPRRVAGRRAAPLVELDRLPLDPVALLEAVSRSAAAGRGTRSGAAEVRGGRRATFSTSRLDRARPAPLVGQGRVDVPVTTTSPPASAGATTRSTCSALSAAYSSAPVRSERLPVSGRARSSGAASSDLCVPRLVGEEHVVPLVAEPRRQPLRLGRLAGPLATLERMNRRGRRRRRPKALRRSFTSGLLPVVHLTIGGDTTTVMTPRRSGT